MLAASMMTAQSTIFKRHSARHPDVQAPEPSNFDLPYHDEGIMDTITKSKNRSTIFQLHELRHKQIAPRSQTHMEAVKEYQSNSSWDMLTTMQSHSTIPGRNGRRRDQHSGETGI
mmetsp:Transcript_37711/g.53180  ORF Transcript_37711/g.53180 Transcript_37711/m.53180 type:complete len:115 (+) Transcript_37711:55-399(+)